MKTENEIIFIYNEIISFTVNVNDFIIRSDPTEVYVLYTVAKEKRTPKRVMPPPQSPKNIRCLPGTVMW